MIPHSRPTIGDEDVAAVAATLRSGMIAEGAAAAALEQAFAATWQGEAVAVGSGSQALVLALRAVGVAPGRAVILPSYVCAEVLGVVEVLGATPVIVDVRPDGLLDPRAAAGAVGPETAAMIVPGVFGLVPEVAAYRAAGVPVVTDMAQCLDPSGGTADIGDVAAFSFEATKLMAAGEGGMVVTRDPALADGLRAAKRVAGTPYKMNLYPLSDLQAVLALAQWKRLPEFLATRRAMAAQYVVALAGVGGAAPISGGAADVHHRFVLRLPSRGLLDGLIAAFAERGVAARRPVDCLLHRLRPTRGLACPVAESLYDTALSLPLHPSLTGDDLARVIAVARDILARVEGGGAHA